MRRIVIATFVSALTILFTQGVLAETGDFPANEEIRIGVFYPMTGMASGFGQEGWKGLKLAHQERPEVLGKKVKLILIDNKSNPIDTADAVSRLIEQENVVALIGGLIPFTTFAAATIAEEAKIPMISPSVTDPLLTENKTYIFRACFTDPQEGSLGARFAREKLNAKAVAVMVDVEWDYSIETARAFIKEFEGMESLMITERSLTNLRDQHPEIPADVLEKLQAITNQQIITGKRDTSEYDNKKEFFAFLRTTIGDGPTNQFGELIFDNIERVYVMVPVKTFYEISDESNDTDILQQVFTFSKLEPEIKLDLIYIPGSYDYVAEIVRQARESVGINIPIMTGAAAKTEELITSGGEAVEGLYLTTHFNEKGVTTESGRRFVQLFDETYNQTPDSVSALSWDAYNILLEAIEKAITNSHSRTLVDGIEQAGFPDANDIRDGLAANFNGATGTFQLREGDIEKSLVVVKIENGEFSYVSTIVPPPPPLPRSSYDYSRCSTVYCRRK